MAPSSRAATSAGSRPPGPPPPCPRPCPTPPRPQPLPAQRQQALGDCGPAASQLEDRRGRQPQDRGLLHGLGIDDRPLPLAEGAIGPQPYEPTVIHDAD